MLQAGDEALDGASDAIEDPWVTRQVAFLSSPAVGVSFDPLQERIWATHSDGFLSSYTLPELQTYSSSRFAFTGEEDDAAWSVTQDAGMAAPRCSASGVVVASGPALRVYDRGGHVDGEVLASALAAATASPDGGFQARITAALPLDSLDAYGMPSTQRLLVGGEGLGHVHLLDASRLWTSYAAAVPGSTDPAGSTGAYLGATTRAHLRSAVRLGGAATSTLLPAHAGVRASSARSVAAIAVPHRVHHISLGEGSAAAGGALGGLAGSGGGGSGGGGRTLAVA